MSRRLRLSLFIALLLCCVFAIVTIILIKYFLFVIIFACVLVFCELVFIIYGVLKE